MPKLIEGKGVNQNSKQYQQSHLKVFKCVKCKGTKKINDEVCLYCKIK